MSLDRGPIPRGADMSWCTGGMHIIGPGIESFMREGARYCPEHEPPKPDPDVKPYKPSPRQKKRYAFARYLIEQGVYNSDDKAEPLTDAEIDHLARHVLP